MIPANVVLYPHTTYTIIPYNYRFRDGKESFSFIVPDHFRRPCDYFLSTPNSPTLKFDLKCWACQTIGREFDIDRCSGMAMRVVDGKLEVRLEFDPPWWYAGA